MGGCECGGGGRGAGAAARAHARGYGARAGICVHTYRLGPFFFSHPANRISSGAATVERNEGIVDSDTLDVVDDFEPLVLEDMTLKKSSPLDIVVDHIRALRFRSR